MNKNWILIAFLALAIALGIGALRVAAQGPTNTFPGGAIGADNLSHFIPANAHLWYYFQYAGDNTQFSVTLVNAAKDNLDFKLYLPTQITLPNEFDSDKPIGRGSRSNIPCPAGQDSCDQQNNKSWLGNVTIAGRYYVEVINNTSEGKAFLLRIDGPRDSVSLQPPTPTTLPTPVVSTNTPVRIAQATPNAMLTLMAQVAATLKAPLPGGAPAATATTVARAAATNTPEAAAAATPEAPPPVVVVAVPTATATPDNFYYTSALWIYDSRLRVLPPKTDTWWKFEHSGDRTVATVLVPDAKLSGLEFKVYTSDGVKRYADEDKPVGLGTQPPGTCSSGPCSSNDLMWSGAFSTADTIYIRVRNTSEKFANLRFQVTGSGVVLGH